MEIRPDDPLAADVRPLLERHVEAMRAASPPGSSHALDPAGLAGPEVAFFTLREAGAVLGMGAVKRIAPGHYEIKSMHVVAAARGRGLSKVLLDRLVAAARAGGAERISLETGAQDAFAPARALYAAAGFSECPAFGDYRPDPNSVFMTRALG